jgi:hypothetical protein
MASSASRRNLRLVSAAPGESQTFAVSFTPAAQRFAWARRPANSFGWVGSGQLHCDAHGVHIDGRRMTPLGLRHLRQTLGAGQIRDVYRQGAVIQMHLRSGARRGVIRLWAQDAAQATQLVARLPTQRTIEVETSPAVQVPRPRRSLARGPWLLLGLIALLAATYFLRARLLPEAAPAPAPRPAGTSAAVAPSAPLASGTDADLFQARLDLENFTTRFAALSTQFDIAFSALTVGTMSQGEFVAGLETWLGPQWATLAHQLPPASAATLRGQVDEQLHAVVSNWQRALALYAHGLRVQDAREVNTAFYAMRSADQHAARASGLVAAARRAAD